MSDLSGKNHSRYILLSIFLMALIVCTIGGITSIAANPTTGEQFTEFYILGPDGIATDYPLEAKVGEEIGVMLGVVNWEHSEMIYRVDVVVDGLPDNNTDWIVLAYQDKWEQKLEFTPAAIGEDQKIEFLLYKYGEGKPSQTLNLWVNVIENL